MLWNKAWNSGTFPDEWKLEHGAIFPKSPDCDLHEEKTYHTVSLTSIIGKRFESITAMYSIIPYFPSAILAKTGMKCDIDEWTLLHNIL